MKKILIAMTLVFAVAVSLMAEEHPADTIVVNIGHNAKILILVNSRQDLNELKNYDLNAILNELSMSVDTMSDGDNYLKIEDNSGRRYLKDTTIVYGEEEQDDRDGDYERKYYELLAEMHDRERENPDNNSYNSNGSNDYNNGNDNDDRRDSRRERRYYNRGTRNYFNFDLGMNNYLEEDRNFPDAKDALYTVKPWGSWYVGITNTNRTHVFGPVYLDWGAGVNWYNFKFQNPTTRFDKSDIQTLIYNDTSFADPLKSKLTVTYIDAFFIPMFNFGHSGRRKDIFHWSNYDNGFRFGAGVYAGYRIDSYTKFMWTENDKKRFNRTHDNYFLNNLRYGIRARLGFESFDFFADYDLSELFIDGKGPKLNPVSFGVIF